MLAVGTYLNSPYPTYILVLQGGRDRRLEGWEGGAREGRDVMTIMELVHMAWHGCIKGNPSGQLNIHTRSLARTHTRTHTRTHARTHARAHTHTHTNTNTHLYTHAHAHTHTYTYTYTFTYTYTYTYT